MSLWSRFTMLFKAKASRRLDSMERVDETLDYGYAKQQELLVKVKQGIREMATAKKRVELQADKLRAQVTKLDGQARQALGAGRDDLARAAIERKQVAEVELGKLDAQVASLQDQQDRLIENERKLRAKVDAFRVRKETIKAQYSAAEAQVQISEAATGLSGQFADVGLAMQRAQDKTDQMVARAAAVEELEAAGTFDLPGLGSGGDDLDRELAALTSASQIDSELDHLRAELSGPSTPAALEAAPDSITSAGSSVSSEAAANDQ